MTTLFVRLWASVPILVVLLYATGGRLTASTLRRTAPAGVLFGLNLARVFTALHHATVAVVSVMSALQPGLVLVIAALVLKERITPTQVIWTAVGIGGAALVILGAGKQVHTSTLGLTLSILAMVTFTIYFLLAKRIRRTTPIGAFEWMAGATRSTSWQ